MDLTRPDVAAETLETVNTAAAARRSVIHAATRAGQRVWRAEFPLCAAVLAVPGVTQR